MHASSLSVRLRRAMLAALAGPTLCACGGVVDPGDAGSDDSGTSPDVYHPLPGCDATDVDAGVVGCGGKHVQLSGDLSKCDVESDTGQPPPASCVAICGGQQYSYCTFDPSTNVVSCEGVCVGRLPSCLRETTLAHTPDAVGEYLARAAYLEAAAVDAFAILAAELRAHGAPRSLVRSAQRAGADEVRHAREVGALARAFGAEPPAPDVGRTTVRPLLDVALENAIEGCVRETFGALVATWQAGHADDLRVRAAMKRIARDETRHAALGWRIFDWSFERLGASEREHVLAAMRGAIADLERSLATQTDAGVARRLGLPSPRESLAMLAAMRAETWAEAEAA